MRQRSSLILLKPAKQMMNALKVTIMIFLIFIKKRVGKVVTTSDLGSRLLKKLLLVLRCWLLKRNGKVNQVGNRVLTAKKLGGGSITEIELSGPGAATVFKRPGVAGLFYKHLCHSLIN